MTRERTITVTEKLAGLAVAILVVGGLSSVAGSFLHPSENHVESEFIAFDESDAPVVRIDAVEGEDFVFSPREYMDERSGKALEHALDREKLELGFELRQHEMELRELSKSLRHLEDLPNIPEPLRLEMVSELSMEMRRVKHEIRRVVADAERVRVEMIAAAQTVRAVEIIKEAAEAPLPRALPLPPVSPEMQACEEPKKKPAKEKGSKDGREGFIEALSFV